MGNIEKALSEAADAMFMEAAPDELPLADDCPEAHAALVRQARAAIHAFLIQFEGSLTVADLVAELGATLDSAT